MSSTDRPNIEQQAGEGATQIGQIYGAVTIHIHNLPDVPSAAAAPPVFPTTEAPPA